MKNSVLLTSNLNFFELTELSIYDKGGETPNWQQSVPPPPPPEWPPRSTDRIPSNWPPRSTDRIPSNWPPRPTDRIPPEWPPPQKWPLPPPQQGLIFPIYPCTIRESFFLVGGIGLGGLGVLGFAMLSFIAE